MSTPTATIPSLDSTLLRDQCYIGGVWRAARRGRTFAVTNPANGARVGEVPDCEPADVETAIAAAVDAFDDWSQRPAGARAALLDGWARLMYTHQADLAHLMTLEQGKPLAESSGEVGYAAQFLEDTLKEFEEEEEGAAEEVSDAEELPEE